MLSSLVGGVSLRVDFEISKAHARTSLFLLAARVDQDRHLLLSSTAQCALPVPCHDGHGLTSKTVSKPLVKCAGTCL